MRIIVIGGTGHIGGFLVPKLVELGHEVTVATRGRRPAPTGPAWKSVHLLTIPPETGPAFLAQQNPEVLIDIVQADATANYEAMRETVEHFIYCGSLWMLGSPQIVPTPEVRFGPALSKSYQPRMDELCELQRRCRRDDVAFTAVLPPNIAGPGKIPLELSGGRDLAVHTGYARGEAVTLFEGCGTLIGPCDAEDVAQVFWRAAEHRDAAAGEFFNAGSTHALPAPEMAEVYGDIYGVHLPVRFVPFETFVNEVMPEPGANTHFLHHMCPDISKAAERLGYCPRHTPAEALGRAVEWMRHEGMLPA
jgi:nucleoside-diphosphate-sugar epimerase